MKLAHFATPEEAESAFYHALERADLDAMMAVWEDSEAVVCIHPMGPRLQGAVQIRDAWRRIFSSGSRLRFQVGGIRSLIQADLAIRLVYEHITVLDTEEQPAQPIVATNIYRRTGSGWRMLLHHAFPGPAVPPGGRDRRLERMH